MVREVPTDKNNLEHRLEMKKQNLKISEGTLQTKEITSPETMSENKEEKKSEE